MNGERVIIHNDPRPLRLWIDYIISLLNLALTTIVGFIVTAFFYEEDREYWKTIFKYFIGLLLITLLLMTISMYLDGDGEIWIEEIKKALWIFQQ